MLITTSCFFTNPMRKIVKRRKFPTPLQHTPLSPSLLSRNSLNARKVEKDFASAALLWLGPGGFLLQESPRGQAKAKPRRQNPFPSTGHPTNPRIKLLLCYNFLKTGSKPRKPLNIRRNNNLGSLAVCRLTKGLQTLQLQNRIIRACFF